MHVYGCFSHCVYKYASYFAFVSNCAYFGLSVGFSPEVVICMQCVVLLSFFVYQSSFSFDFSLVLLKTLTLALCFVVALLLTQWRAVV